MLGFFSLLLRPLTGGATIAVGFSAALWSIKEGGEEKESGHPEGEGVDVEGARPYLQMK